MHSTLQTFEKRFRTAPKYKVNFCAIEKNLSTVMTAILCFLFDEQKFRQKQRKINKELFHNRLCKDRNEAFSMTELTSKFNTTLLDNWLHLAVVRHPIDRFLSGFVDKCVIERTWRDNPLRCNGCRNNLTCFIHAQYERMRKFAFNAYQLNSFDDRHFFPQNWRCQFNEHFRRFTFLRYSSTPEGIERFFSSLFALFRAHAVPEESIEFIKNETSHGRASHSTWHKKQRQLCEKLLRENDRLLDLLVRMYYFDFQIFGYSIMKWE